MKILLSAITYILPGLLAIACQAHSNDIEQQKIAERSSNMQLSQSQKAHDTQSATNSKGTLYGENLGDSILLRWTLNDSATEYIVYRSTSLTGPWDVNGRLPQAAVRTGGATEELTPDARLMDLCYKVEALDGNGTVIELYEPICVPKFVPQNP